MNKGKPLRAAYSVYVNWDKYLKNLKCCPRTKTLFVTHSFLRRFFVLITSIDLTIFTLMLITLDAGTLSVNTCLSFQLNFQQYDLCCAQEVND